MSTAGGESGPETAASEPVQQLKPNEPEPEEPEPEPEPQPQPAEPAEPVAPADEPSKPKPELPTGAANHEPAGQQLEPEPEPVSPEPQLTTELRTGSSTRVPALFSILKPPSSSDEDEATSGVELVLKPGADEQQAVSGLATRHRVVSFDESLMPKPVDSPRGDEAVSKLAPRHRGVVSFNDFAETHTPRGATVVRVCVPNSTSRLKRSSSANIMSVRKLVQLRDGHIFDMSQLDSDIQRVFGHLKERFGEEYALHIVFTIRTAEELHRAWHMTLLTTKLMQQLKETFNLVMTWELGVLRLKFRVEDGDYELHRKVPYDYDSEFQDKYTRIATALIQGNIDIHRALTYQSEIKEGKHTAKTGLFLRSFPGRLLLYPVVAGTCAMIFFGGDLTDAAIAAVCGLASGFIELSCGYMGQTGKVTLDVLVGISTVSTELPPSHPISRSFLAIQTCFASLCSSTAVFSSA